MIRGHRRGVLDAEAAKSSMSRRIAAARMDSFASDSRLVGFPRARKNLAFPFIRFFLQILL